MNIFVVDLDPRQAARDLSDKHVVKMIIEYAQLMSTANRVLDGEEYIDLTANGRRIKRWRMPDVRETVLMKASHINHPSAIWCRVNQKNYMWLYSMWYHLLEEYTHRYGKTHACARLIETLAKVPFNIPRGEFFPPTPAMPDECKVTNNSLASYHKYYIEKKNHFAKWTKREVPLWFANTMSNNANI